MERKKRKKKENEKACIEERKEEGFGESNLWVITD